MEDEIRTILDRDEVEQSATEVQRIRITRYTPEGMVTIAPILGEDGKRMKAAGISNPREALIHPTDWERIAAELEWVKERPDEFNLTLFNGIPVVYT